MNRSLPTRAVIFDVDGVLVSTDELHFIAWSAIADAEGIPFDRAANDALRGVSRMASLELLLRRASRAYSDAEKRSLAERKNRLFVEAVAKLGPGDVTPGARSLIASLRERGLRVAAASSSRNARRILQQIELAGVFEVIFDGNDVAASKPDPALFLRTAAALGVEPAACVVVEDAPAGVEAARRAGMRVIGVGSVGLLAGADCVVASLAGLSVEGVVDVRADRG